MTKKDTINGLILAGGKSSRMGYDKSLLVVHDKPQREYLVDLLKKHVDNVFLSCKKGADINPLFNPIPDQYDLKSPLNGILSAFTFDPTSAWLVIAVDMPLITDEALKFLLANRDAKKVATCFADSDGTLPEPLFTLWEPKAFALLKYYYNKGNISPRNFLKTHDVKILQAPDKRILTNINSVEDLEKLNEKK